MTIIYDNDHILHIHDDDDGDDDDDEEEEEQPLDWHRLRMMKIESVRKWDRIGDGDMDSMKGLARRNEDFTIKKQWITQWIKSKIEKGLVPTWGVPQNCFKTIASNGTLVAIEYVEMSLTKVDFTHKLGPGTGPVLHFFRGVQLWPELYQL